MLRRAGAYLVSRYLGSRHRACRLPAHFVDAELFGCHLKARPPQKPMCAMRLGELRNYTSTTFQRFATMCSARAKTHGDGPPVRARSLCRRGCRKLSNASAVDILKQQTVSPKVFRLLFTRTSLHRTNSRLHRLSPFLKQRQTLQWLWPYAGDELLQFPWSLRLCRVEAEGVEAVVVTGATSAAVIGSICSKLAYLRTIKNMSALRSGKIFTAAGATTS